MVQVLLGGRWVLLDPILDAKRGAKEKLQPKDCGPAGEAGDSLSRSPAVEREMLGTASPMVQHWSGGDSGDSLPGGSAMEWGDVGDSLSRAPALTPLPASPQPVTVTCTPGAAASTRSCTSCRGARAGASASTVATTPPAATATTARRATTATWGSPSPTGRPAKVGRAPGPREHRPLPLLFRFLVPGTDLPGKRAGHLHACAHARTHTYAP